MWRVLIVEDEFVSRTKLLSILEDDAKCDVASNGKEALEAYGLSLEEKNPYDLILLDIGLPDMDGMEILKQIRQEETKAGILLGRGIPIIMVTIHKPPFIDSFKEGCDDYILKPVEREKLLEKMHHLIKKEPSESE